MGGFEHWKAFHCPRTRPQSLLLRQPNIALPYCSLVLAYTLLARRTCIHLHVLHLSVVHIQKQHSNLINTQIKHTHISPTQMVLSRLSEPSLSQLHGLIFYLLLIDVWAHEGNRGKYTQSVFIIFIIHFYSCNFNPKYIFFSAIAKPFPGVCYPLHEMEVLLLGTDVFGQ